MDFMAANSVSVRLCRPAIDQVESTGKFHQLLACHRATVDMWVVSVLCLIGLQNKSVFGHTVLFNPAVGVKLECPDLNANKPIIEIELMSKR